jgi:uncharacterized protein (TIGR02145 family)
MNIPNLILLRKINTYRKIFLSLITLIFLFNSGCITINPPVLGATVKDVDGNVYHTVIIGTQTWMIENLKTTHYNDNTAIPMITDSAAWRNMKTPGYCWYKNDSSTNKATFGALYNWYAVDSTLLAPVGWHIPTEGDWSTLENNVTVYLYASGSLAKILAGTTGWNKSPNMGAIGNNLVVNNTSKFDALPGGSRENYIHSFNSIDSTGVWWSSTLESDTTSLGLVMKCENNSVDRYNKYKWNGLSVRCVKDSK